MRYESATLTNFSTFCLFSDNIIFTLSMITSFCALVYFGLQFNERETNAFVKWLISLPMFLTSVAARGFTFAVFLKETTIPADIQSPSTSNGTENAIVSDESCSFEWIGGLCVIAIYCGLNVIAFRISGQDYIRFTLNYFVLFYSRLK